jgi:phosphate:Na+ symporter
MFEHFDIWIFLAGLGIFMFGMFMLEESIKQLSGRTFKNFIKKTTTGRIKSLFTGMFSTAVLQSSSAVSLMTLTFVGAGIMSMQNAVGVIMGTNIGTTLTGWIIATIGFKVNIEGLSLPFIGIGGLGLIFLGKSPKFMGITKLLVGIGFLFLGLDYMKQSVEGFANAIDLNSIPHYGILFYVFLGIVLTALMQSSSASLAIVFTALGSGIISFNEGAAFVIGANIGTTVTVLLGAIGAIQIKKQVAISHLFFNIITGIVAFLILPIYGSTLKKIGVLNGDDVFNIAVFHSFFNILGVLIFFPFIGLLAEKIQQWFPEKITPTTKFINNISHDLPEASLQALKLEVKHLYKETLIYGFMILNVDEKNISKISSNEINEKLKNQDSQQKQFEKIKMLHNAIMVYASQMQQSELESSEKLSLHSCIHVSLQMIQITKTFTGFKDDVESLENSGTPKAQFYFADIQQRNINLWVKLYLIASEKEIFHDTKAINELSEKLELDYEDYVFNIAKDLENNTIKEKHASLFLILNGLLTQSNRVLCNSILEITK